MINPRKGGHLINSHAYKRIRLVYDKKGGAWNLGVMEMSEGVREMLGEIPHFDPQSAQPERLHLKSILDLLHQAGLDGGLWQEVCGPDKYEVNIEIKKRERHIHRYQEAASQQPV